MSAYESDNIPIQRSGPFLIVPLPGNPDIERVDAMCRSVIAAAHAERPVGVIFDCSATQLLDRAIIEALDFAAASIRLFGCRAAVSGISPSLCSALVILDVRLTNLLKSNDLARALEMMSIERNSRE